MTAGTIFGNSDIQVVGICSRNIIFLVTSITVGRGLGIIACGMAGAAVIDVMALGQREKVVVDVGGGPVEGIHHVTIGAIC